MTLDCDESIFARNGLDMMRSICLREAMSRLKEKDTIHGLPLVFERGLHLLWKLLGVEIILRNGQSLFGFHLQSLEPLLLVDVRANKRTTRIVEQKGNLVSIIQTSAIDGSPSRHVMKCEAPFNPS